MKVQMADSLSGTLCLPGDKSISHRAAILAAMALGETTIANFSTAVDCRTTLNCLRQMGVEILETDNVLCIKGVGKRGFRRPEMPLDCGNSGTTARLLAGLLAGQTFDSILTGDESLKKRPMQRVLEPLGLMGAKFESENSLLPIGIRGGQELTGIEHNMQIASAQVKSGLMIAGLLAKGRTIVHERSATRDHTERLMGWFGVDVQAVANDPGKRIYVNGDAELRCRDLQIPADISSAAYFIAGAACLNRSNVSIPVVGLNPTRAAFIDIVRGLNADIEVSQIHDLCGEPVGTITIRGGIAGKPHSEQNRLNGDIIPLIIDEIPVLAILGTQIDGGLEIRDAAELRLKESDRIYAIIENLRRMGANVTEFPDGFKVEQSVLNGAVIDSFGDHRIAMAFAIAGLIATGETRIIGAECADISFPGFFDVLSKMTRGA